MNDARQGIVRLDLPDGRSVPLQLTYAALDARGHDWMVERFRLVAAGTEGSAFALADLLEVLSGGAILADDVKQSAAFRFPIHTATTACWGAWSLAQHGPNGRSGDDAPENPRKRRLIRWRSR